MTELTPVPATDRERSIRAICAEFGVDPEPYIRTGYEPAAVRHELETK